MQAQTANPYPSRRKSDHNIKSLRPSLMAHVATGTLALAKAMYGVELADVGSRDVARLELTTVRTLWGPMRNSRAK